MLRSVYDSGGSPSQRQTAASEGWVICTSMTETGAVRYLAVDANDWLPGHRVVRLSDVAPIDH